MSDRLSHPKYGAPLCNNQVFKLNQGPLVRRVPDLIFCFFFSPIVSCFINFIFPFYLLTFIIESFEYLKVYQLLGFILI